MQESQTSADVVASHLDSGRHDRQNSKPVLVEDTELGVVVKVGTRASAKRGAVDSIGKSTTVENHREPTTISIILQHCTSDTTLKSLHDCMGQVDVAPNRSLLWEARCIITFLGGQSDDHVHASYNCGGCGLWQEGCQMQLLQCMEQSEVEAPSNKPPMQVVPTELQPPKKQSEARSAQDST